MPRVLDIRQPAIELSRGKGGGVVGEGLLDSLPHALDALARERRDGDHGRIADEHELVLQIEAHLLLCLGAFDDIPFVEHHDERAATLSGIVRYALVLVRDAERAVDHEHSHIRAIYCAHGTHESVVLHRFGDLALLAHARRVDDAIQLIIMRDEGIDGISRRPRNRAHD